MSIKADFQLDAKGLSCPMPIVKTKKGNGRFSGWSDSRSASNG